MKQIYRGDKKYYGFQFLIGEPPAPVNITGMTVRLTVKKKESDTYANAVIKKLVTVHSDAVNGKSGVTLYHSDTLLAAGDYFLYVDLLDGEGEPVTFKQDKLSILPSAE